MARDTVITRNKEFEPVRKNPIGLLDDSNLDSELKTLLVGGEPTGLELSKGRTRINTVVEFEKLDSNLFSTGSFFLEDDQKLIFNSNVGTDEDPWAGSGAFTSIYSSGSGAGSSGLYINVGGVLMMSLLGGGGMGVNEEITTFSSNLKLDKGKKLILDADDDEDYIMVDSSTNDMFFYVENTKVLDLDGSGHMTLQNECIVDATAANTIDFQRSTGTSMLLVDSEGIYIQSSDKLVLDGGGNNDTYILESSEDVLDFYVGADKAISINNALDLKYIGISATWKLAFDGGSNTYITESSADVLDIYVGGDKMLSLDESVDTGVTSLIGTLKIKEQADASADTAGYGQLWVDTATPNELAFTDDAGTDIIGIGKYHYETKFIGYYATATGIYFPMTGYIFESTSATGKNEFISFIAPYNGTIQKVGVRTEIAQSGDADLRVLESTDGTEIPGSTIFRNATAISLADDTYFELDMTDPVTGSSYSPLTKGRIYNIYLGTPAATYDTNVTIVFKWDITS